MGGLTGCLHGLPIRARTELSLAHSRLGSQPVVGFFAERALPPSLSQHTLELFLWVCIHGLGLVWCLPRWLTGKSSRANHALSVSVRPKVRFGKDDALCEAGFPGSARIPPSVLPPVLGGVRCWDQGVRGGPEHHSTGTAWLHNLSYCVRTPSFAALYRMLLWEFGPKSGESAPNPSVCPGGGCRPPEEQPAKTSSFVDITPLPPWPTTLASHVISSGWLAGRMA